MPCLWYFVNHPGSSAYDIEPGRRTNQSNYRYAKLTLEKLQNLKLIKPVKSGKVTKKKIHPSKKYLLTDHGIFYLINNTKIFRTTLLKELFKNYHNINLFQFLVYPFMNLKTICSPKFHFHFLAGMGKYLVNSIQRIYDIVSRFEKRDKSDRVICFWQYNKLEYYLRKTLHCEFVDYYYSEEDFDDDRYQQITYFDEKNKNNSVVIKFDKKSKKAWVYRKNKRVKKYEIPFATDYVTMKVIPHKIDIVRHFHTLCGPKVEEFVLTVFPFFKIVGEGNILELLKTDKPFKEAIKTTKNRFDGWYKLIMSLSDPLF